MSLRRQLGVAFALQGGGAAAVLLATLWLGATLGPAQQGAFSHLKSQVEFVAAFAMFGLPQALFFYLQSGRLGAAAARRWALASALLALPLAALFAWLWQGGSPLHAVLAPAVAACVLHGQLRTQLLAGAGTVWFSLLTALPQLLVLAGVVALVGLGGSGTAAWAWLFALAYGVAAGWAWQRLRARPQSAVQRPARGRDLLHYGSAAWLAAVLSTAALLAVQRLVEATAGAAALGLFTLAATLVQVPLTPVGYAAPLLLRRWMQQPGAQAARRAARALGLLLLGLALGAAALSTVWPDLGLGAAYDGVTGALAVLLAGAAAEAVARVLAALAGASGRPWVTVRAEAARWTVLSIGTLLLLGPLAGAGLLGACVLWTLAASAYAAVFVFDARREPPEPAAPRGPLRVALLGPANSIHVQRWAQAIAGRGHALCVISQHRCDAALLPPSAMAVWLPHEGVAGYFANVPRLRRTLRQWRPDLLHAHYASGYGTSAMLAGFAPTLLSVWGSDVHEFPQRGALAAWLLRRNLRSATALAATSRALAAQVRRLVPDRKDDIALTPFGVDLDRFRPRTLPPPQGLTVGIVKALAPTYGVDLLLQAFAGLQADAELRAAQPTLRLLVVGDGPQRAELEALAARLGLGTQVCFAGAVAHDEVPRWLHRIDVFVAPSRAESFGVAVVEAGACGLPVVVSGAGGLPEVVRDGLTGLVVPVGDVAALQAAIKRLLLDAALRERMGRAAREHVLREYAWEPCIDRLMACYLALARTA